MRRWRPGVCLTLWMCSTGPRFPYRSSVGKSATRSESEKCTFFSASSVLSCSCPSDIAYSNSGQGSELPNFLTSNIRATERKNPQLQIICDPTFTPREHPQHPQSWRLPVESEEDILCGPISAYDLGTPIPLGPIPPCPVMLYAGGPDLMLLTSGNAKAELAKWDMVFRPSCHQFASTAARVRTRPARDTTWLAVLKMDPLSKNFYAITPRCLCGATTVRQSSSISPSSAETACRRERRWVCAAHVMIKGQPAWPKQKCPACIPRGCNPLVGLASVVSYV